MRSEQEFIRAVEVAYLLAINRHQSKEKTFDLLMSRILLASDTYYATPSNERTVQPKTKGTRTHPT